MKLKFQQKIDKITSLNVPNLNNTYCVHKPQADKHKIATIYHVIHGEEKQILFSFRKKKLHTGVVMYVISPYIKYLRLDLATS